MKQLLKTLWNRLRGRKPVVVSFGCTVENHVRAQIVGASSGFSVDGVCRQCNGTFEVEHYCYTNDYNEACEAFQTAMNKAVLSPYQRSISIHAYSKGGNATVVQSCDINAPVRVLEG